MIDIKILDLRLDTALMRFYLMMLGAIVLGFAGYLIAAAIWAGVIAISAILGVNISLKKIGQTSSNEVESRDIVNFPHPENLQKVG